MPSLKPRTAPPRSVPMLRSFLVPKISITITRTISQCQMLSEPIFRFSYFLLQLALAFQSLPLEHRSQRLGAAQDVHVDMIHLLMPGTTGVDDGAKALGRAFLARQLARERQHPAERVVVAHVRFVQAR